ncbi:MAG TPA: pitrilysin family protein [Candidatus Acidoferrum sp.]|jgi:zinc protease|nr:pitrilysin family protein [Candidatus Acidoferrum sp.]
MTIGRRLAVTLLAVTMLIVPGPAPAQAPAENVRLTRLANGLTVVVRENPVAPVVAIALLVRMGSRWETPDNAGISNFTHAVMVKGTAKRGGGELAEAVAGLGGKISAAGDVDYSGIQASALARYWRELLELTAELALQPKMAPEDVDRERDWLLSRLQRRRDNAPSRAFDEFYAAVYRSHPYALPSLGTRESLARIDHAALVAWYRAFYRPERMTLAVSGQVSSAEVVAEARRLFGAVPGAAMPPDPSVPPPRASGGRIVVEAPAQQTQILLGGLAPALDDPDHAAVKVLSTILGGGMAGRLFVELRDRSALAYTATSYYDPVREPGALVLYLGTAPASSAQAEQALMREVQKIRDVPVSDDELTRAKGYLLGRYAMDRRTNERLAWYLAFYEVEGVGRGYPERFRQRVEAVTVADVQRVARTYLAQVTTIVLGPAPGR